MDDTRPLAFSYVRFSTLEQRKGDSKRRQMDRTRDYAREHDLRLDERTYADLGMSAFRGANSRDGELGLFLGAVEQGRIPKGSFLLIESLDRISRDAPYAAVDTLMRICHSGIAVITLADGQKYDESLGKTNHGAYLMAVIVAIRAHEESATKSMRLKAVWLKKRLVAPEKPMTGLCPAWLTLGPDRKAFSILPERAAIITRIFANYLEGIGPHLIANRLNEEGADTFGRGGSKARYWHRSYVKKILQNRSVIGEFTPHVIDYEGGKKRRVAGQAVQGYFPIVVDSETFSRAAAMQVGKRAPASFKGQPTVSHLLAGLAKCPQCRGAMVRVNKGSLAKSGRPYLVCNRAKVKADCQYRGVRVDTLEALVPAHLKRLSEYVPETASQTAIASLKLAEEQYADAKARQDRLLAFIVEGERAEQTNPESIRQLLLTESARAEEARQVLEDVRTVVTGWDQQQAQGRLSELLRAMGTADASKPKLNALMRQVFSHIYVHYDLGALDYYWRNGGRQRIMCEGL